MINEYSGKATGTATVNQQNWSLTELEINAIWLIRLSGQFNENNLTDSSDVCKRFTLSNFDKVYTGSWAALWTEGERDTDRFMYATRTKARACMWMDMANLKWRRRRDQELVEFIERAQWRYTGELYSMYSKHSDCNWCKANQSWNVDE